MRGPGSLMRPWAAARPPSGPGAWPGCAVGGGPPASCPRCSLLLVAPLVFRAPSDPAARAASFARRVDSLSGQALPPPRAPQPGPSDPPAPSTPVTRGVLCVASPHPRQSDVARNSPAATSNHEFRSLELRRLWMVSKSDRGKLCATFISLGSCHRP